MSTKSTKPRPVCGVTTKSTAAVAAAAAAAAVLLPQHTARADWSVLDKDIPELESAYSSTLTTVQDVVNQYLDRINTYNKHGGGGGTLGTGGNGINAIAQINPNLASAEASVQTLINSGATTSQYPLLGVPVIVKNSYDVAGMVTTNGVSVLNGSGTPGSTTLIAPNDCFSVAQLKAAGAIILGKANMSTMAYSFDGIDNAGGVVENPYNPLRQPGGSSSGTGAGVAAQFAMFGMGGETGGSIRVPSNANDDVGLKTSAGLIDPGGTWPLTPSRDVVGPIARDVTDIAYAMNALVATSPNNLWNNTPYYPSGTPQPGTVGTGSGEGTDPGHAGLTATTGTRPTDYTSFLNRHALQGKIIAVPNSMYNVGNQPEGTVAPLVMTAFNNALAVIQAEGATIVHVDIPASVTYYSTLGRPSGSGGATTSGFPYPYPTTTVGGTTPSSVWSNDAAAYYYEKLIESYGDPTIKNLSDFATALKNGRDAASGSAYSTLSSAFNNINSLATIWQNAQAAGFDPATNPDAIKALQAFASLREDQYDSFMANPSLFGVSGVDHIDAFVAPDYGTVMPYVTSLLRPPGTPADPYAVSGAASLFGRFEGNILGDPSLAVPMGFFPDGTPMDLQFFDQLDGEAKLIGFGYDFEQSTEFRQDPNLSFVPEPAMGGAILVTAAGIMTRRRRKRE
jgi:amidase